MLELIRSAALIWVGAIIRNKDDRNATLKFFNGIGNKAEGIIKDFLPKGGAVNNEESVGTAPQQQEEYN